MNIFLYKIIKVPKDLRSVTSYNPEDEVEPAEAGMSRKGVVAIWSAVEALYRTGDSPGNFILSPSPWQSGA